MVVVLLEMQRPRVHIQGSPKERIPGFKIFFILHYHLCQALPAKFSKPGAYSVGDPLYRTQRQCSRAIYRPAFDMTHVCCLFYRWLANIFQRASFDRQGQMIPFRREGLSGNVLHATSPLRGAWVYSQWEGSVESVSVLLPWGIIPP